MTTALKPNIILINCDDLGYGDLGCYGSPVNDTPTLDRLAWEGLRFTDFYMASPVCSPSRGAMMTGCYPPRIGFGKFCGGKWVLFPGDNEGLNPTETSIAKVLKSAGYSTKLVGKWHCGDQKEFLPTEHGFDDYFGIPYSNDMGVQKRSSDLSNRPPLPLMRGSEVHQQQPDQRGLTERYADECVTFIKKNRSQPFFLYLAHMYVHVPLFVPEQFKNASRNGAYGGAVACIDWCTSVLMHTLKEQGLDENTLIIFTSDNGSRARDEGGSNLPCRGKKGETWEGGLRVPCIMRWPKAIKPGDTCSGIASSIDLYPTLAQLAGAKIPQDRIIDGQDISEILLNGAESPRQNFIYYRRNSLEAVRKGDWKLHFSKNGEAINELYNLAEDVSETENLYHQHPQIVAELTDLADAYRHDIGDEQSGVIGKNNREIGRVDNSCTLTTYDENHPYMIAMYDLADSKVMAG